MGQRIIITVEALLRANCTLMQKIVHHPAVACHVQPFEAYDETLLKVTFPNGFEHYFDFETAGDKLWVESDYNERRETYRELASALAEFKIFHIVH